MEPRYLDSTFSSAASIACARACAHTHAGYIGSCEE